MEVVSGSVSYILPMNSVVSLLFVHWIIISPEVKYYSFCRVYIGSNTGSVGACDFSGSNSSSLWMTYLEVFCR